jgi:hypothetical protein
MQDLKVDETNNCKGCRTSVRVLDNQIQEMLKEIENSGNFELAALDTYEERLDKCAACKYLEYDNTCLQCGCIVHIRARLRKSSCPFPGESRW